MLRPPRPEGRSSSSASSSGSTTGRAAAGQTGTSTSRSSEPARATRPAHAATVGVVTTPSELLTSRFGYPDFRPGQQHVIESLLAGRSALAVFPTGAGKSLCYQLPALMLDGVTVVVSPLIALMKDQIDFLQRSGIEAGRLDSSLDAGEQRAIFDRLQAGSLTLLYVAPERFNNERFLSRLAQARVSLF